MSDRRANDAAMRQQRSAPAEEHPTWAEPCYDVIEDRRQNHRLVGVSGSAFPELAGWPSARRGGSTQVVRPRYVLGPWSTGRHTVIQSIQAYRHLSVCASVGLCCLDVCLYVCMSACLSVSVCLYVCMSVCLGLVTRQLNNVYSDSV